MKFGDELRGAVQGYDDKGRGVFDRTAIPFAAAGDEITATFVKRDKGMRIGRLKEVLTPSPDRVPAPCPHAGVCGGCLWQHLSYEAQIRMKRDMIRRAFERAGHDERVDDVMPCPEPFFYRNRMDYVVGWRGEIGLKEYGAWNRYLDLSTCFLLDKETPAILDAVRGLMRESGLEPWDAKRHVGDLRYCVIRLGKNTGERMITLVAHDLERLLPHASRITENLAPLCTTLSLGENPDITDLSLVKTLVHLHGNALLTEEINGLRYRIHPNSFFQTNSRMAAELQRLVVSWTDGAARTLDLYCGLGFFGIACAKRGAHVYGHELDADAIAMAKKNAELNGVADRTEFGSGPVEDFAWKEKNPDAVIVDPPRAGLHPKALRALIENRPSAIVYVSCNYRRLAEELKQLKTAYRVERLTALDLFPQTPHVEAVAKLARLP